MKDEVITHMRALNNELNKVIMDKQLNCDLNHTYREYDLEIPINSPFIITLNSLQYGDEPLSTYSIKICLPIVGKTVDDINKEIIIILLKLLQHQRWTEYKIENSPMTIPTVIQTCGIVLLHLNDSLNKLKSISARSTPAAEIVHRANKLLLLAKTTYSKIKKIADTKEIIISKLNATIASINKYTSTKFSHPAHNKTLTLRKKAILQLLLTYLNVDITNISTLTELLIITAEQLREHTLTSNETQCFFYNKPGKSDKIIKNILNQLQQISANTSIAPCLNTYIINSYKKFSSRYLRE